MGKQKARDPDLPKRPTNAYLIFCEMEKERIKQVDPNATDLSKSMSDAWRVLSQEERRPYYELYEDDKVRYDREMAEYNQKKEGQPELKKQKIEETEAEPEATTAAEAPAPKATETVPVPEQTPAAEDTIPSEPQLKVEPEPTETVAETEDVPAPVSTADVPTEATPVVTDTTPVVKEE
ncbi:NHP10 Non-histone protein 10 [Candida maltosa Xu316]